MDVEKIQELNNLASNLLSQGLAENKEEAMAQAENILNGKKTEEQDANQQKREDEDNMNVKSNVRGFPDKNYSSNELSSERVQDILEKNTKYVVKALKEFQTKIEMMERKFMMVEKEMMNLKRSLPATPIVEEVSQAPSIEISPANEVDSVGPVSPIEDPVSKVEDSVAAPEQVPKKEVSNNGGSAENSNDPHPKVGRYDDEDVSVENIFYMGSKR